MPHDGSGDATYPPARLVAADDAGGDSIQLGNVTG